MKKRSGLADSPFFPPPTDTKKTKSVTQSGKSKKTERTENRTEFRTENRSVSQHELPVKRRTKRYSFEFYDDQLMKLKQLKHQAEMRGERVSLSDMAREAMDQYLRDR